jgi:hypothetical protein
VAAKRQSKTLLELNTLLAARSGMTESELAAGKRLPSMRQARLMVKAMPKATRVAEFIALWAITKYQEGATSAERLAEFWDQPMRTMYRRLEEFREVWEPAGYDTPDAIADMLIADYRARRERMVASDVAKLLSAQVSVPTSALPGGSTA